MRTLLFQASLPPKFWAEALNMSVHLLNLLPTTTLSFKSPCEILYGTFPTFTHLRVFGCLCYPNLSSTAPHKLSPRSIACVYLGPSSNHRGHRCYDLVSHRIIVSQHVVFDEDHFPYASFNVPPSVSAYDDLVNDITSPTLRSDVPFASFPVTQSPPPVGPNTSTGNTPFPAALPLRPPPRFLPAVLQHRSTTLPLPAVFQRRPSSLPQATMPRRLPRPRLLLPLLIP